MLCVCASLPPITQVSGLPITLTQCRPRSQRGTGKQYLPPHSPFFLNPYFIHCLHPNFYIQTGVHTATTVHVPVPLPPSPFLGTGCICVLTRPAPSCQCLHVEGAESISGPGGRCVSVTLPTYFSRFPKCWGAVELNCTRVPTWSVTYPFDQ